MFGAHVYAHSVSLIYVVAVYRHCVPSDQLRQPTMRNYSVAQKALTDYIQRKQLQHFDFAWPYFIVNHNVIFRHCNQSHVHAICTEEYLQTLFNMLNCIYFVFHSLFRKSKSI